METHVNKLATETLLARYDNYIMEINNKSSFMITFNTFVIGEVILN